MLDSVHAAGNLRRRHGPVIRKGDIEVERQVLPWSAGRCEDETELAHVGVIRDDRNSRIRGVMELSKVLIQPREQER